MRTSGRFFNQTREMAIDLPVVTAKAAEQHTLAALDNLRYAGL